MRTLSTACTHAGHVKCEATGLRFVGSNSRRRVVDVWEPLAGNRMQAASNLAAALYCHIFPEVHTFHNLIVEM